MKVAGISFWLGTCVIYLAVSHGWAADPHLAPPTLLAPPTISSVTLNPSTVTGGTTQVLGTVTLSHPALSSVVMVTLQSSNSTVAPVPASVPIQPGTTSATFVITTQPVTGNPNVVNPNPPSVQISAHIGTSTAVIAQLTVLSPILTALTLNPANVPGGTASTGTVAISGPAPSGGLVVMLSGQPPTSPPSSQAGGLTLKILQNPVSVPSQVTIPAGATSASFSVKTIPVVQPTPFQITAKWGVFVTKTATLTLLPAEIASFSADPWAQLGGAPATGTIMLTAPAPPEGMILYLSQFGRAAGGPPGGFPQCGQIPTMPSTVTVAGSSTSVPVPITTYTGYGTYNAYVCRVPLETCQFNGVQLTHNVNVFGFLVMPPFLTSTSLVVPSSVKGGTPIQGTLQLLGKAMPANCGNSYPLTSSNPLLAQVPPYVTVAPGSSQATFAITTSATTTAQSVTISLGQAVPYSDYQGGLYNNSTTLMTVSAPLTITP